MRARNLALMTTLAATLLAGCASTGPEYADPNETETVTLGFGRTDIQKIVKKAVNDFLAKDPTVDWDPPANPRPYVAVATAQNQTDEHVDTKMVTDLIREALLESGTVRFTTEDKDLWDTLERVEAQEDSGTYKQNERTAKKGNWNPPEYVLRGRFYSIRKRSEDDKVEELYYLFALRLDNINSASTVWTSNTEITKVKEKSTFGY